MGRSAFAETIVSVIPGGPAIAPRGPASWCRLSALFDCDVSPVSKIKSVHGRASEERHKYSRLESAEPSRGNAGDPRKKPTADVGQHEHERTNSRRRRAKFPGQERDSDGIHRGEPKPGGT